MGTVRKENAINLMITAEFRKKKEAMEDEIFLLVEEECGEANVFTKRACGRVVWLKYARLN